MNTLSPARDPGASPRHRFPWRRLATAVPLAALAASAANAAIYLLARLAGVLPGEVLVSGQPITLAPVVISSVVGAVGGGIVFALAGLTARRPTRVFVWVAAVALVLSFATPFTIPGAPAAMLLVLELMHVAAAVAVAGVLVNRTAAE